MKKYNEESVILEKNMKLILDGIPDVIKVFNPDHTIYICNEAGYKFYNKMPEEVKGRVCYGGNDKKNKCKECRFDQALKEKKMISLERYVPEVNKVMDVCYNPVFDDRGQIKYVIERLTDITEKKAINNMLKSDKERYEQILENSPDALVIIVDNKIVLGNKEIANLLQCKYENIIGSDINKFIGAEYIQLVNKRFNNIISHKKTKEIYDSELHFDGKKIHVQISCSYILYEGKAAILATIRNSSDTIKELNRAAQFQRNNLPKKMPFEDYIDVASSYFPAYTVSGDFYRMHKINDDLLVGILIDVRGKGMTAALNVSAFDLLFLQEVSVNEDPLDLLQSINKKLSRYYDENYVAACCFSLDFKKSEFKIVGAGINQFIFQKHGKTPEEKIIKGPFLGMFENSEFSEIIIKVESGDRIYLLSDGLDFIFNKDNLFKDYIGKVSINEFKSYIDRYLEYIILDEGKLKDDSTMLAIEIK